jgi:hypothetical protein
MVDFWCVAALAAVYKMAWIEHFTPAKHHFGTITHLVCTCAEMVGSSVLLQQNIVLGQSHTKVLLKHESMLCVATDKQKQCTHLLRLMSCMADHFFGPLYTHGR